MTMYNKYKSSEVEWIGKIPNHWNLMRLKQNFYIKGRIGWQELKADEFTDEGVHCVTGTDFTNGNVNWETCYRVSVKRYDVDENIQLKENDLLITKDGTIGKVAAVKNMPNKATLNSGIFLIRPNKSYFFNDYLFWILNSSLLTDFNDFTKTGTTINHLYQNVLERMHITVPTFDEQKAISHYLFNEIPKLDKLISNKKAQIEKLKELRAIEINNAVTKGLNPNVELKESGIEWLGKIPKHWVTNRLKNLGKVTGGFAFPSSLFGDEGMLVLKITNIQTMFINWDDIEYIPQKDAEKYSDYFVTNKDLVFALTRPIISTGIKAAILSSLVGHVLLNQRTAVFKPSSKILSSFLYFIVMSNYFYQDFQSHLKITNQPNISTFDIANIKITFPSPEEQNIIAEHLSKRIFSFDKMIENCESQIQKLEELRKIKIYEAVTGKVKVGDYAET